MTNKQKNIFGFVLIGSVILFAMISKKNAQPQVQVIDQAEEKQAIFNAIAPTRDELKKFRNDPNIKRQQELIVEEAYQLDLKVTAEKNKAEAIAAAEKAKAEAIAKYGAELEGIETQLSAIRKEKLSFTFPLKQSESLEQSN